MTIKEFCKIYKVDESGIYKKIKRKGKKLEGHIVVVDGVMQLDEEAVDMLKPLSFAEFMEMENKKNSVIEEMEQLTVKNAEQIEKYNKMISEVNSDFRELELLLADTIRKLKNSEDEKQELEQKYKTAMERVNELEEQLAVESRKRKGIFGR